MRLRRRHKNPRVVPVVNGTNRPVWALRAGQRITASEYDVYERRLILWVHDSPLPSAARWSDDEVEAAIRCYENALAEDPIVTPWAIFSHLEGRCRCASVTQK